MKYPLVTIPLAALLVLTGCSNGSSSGGDDAPVTTPTPPPPPPPPAAAPTVTVTAPATAIANVPFDITWASTDATSCTSAVFTGNATSGTKNYSETKVGEITYEVTCTGAGGSATDAKTVNVSPQAIAEGLWQGTGTGNGGERAISGVITKEDAYWLTYSAAGNTSNVVGFFAGTGASQPDASGTAGTFSSGGLREFNFEGMEAAGGTLSAGTYNKAGTDKAGFTFGASTTATALSATYTFAGTQAYSIDNVTDGLCAPNCSVLNQTPNPQTFDDGGTPWTIVPNANNLAGAPALTGTFKFQPYHIDTDLAPVLGSPDPSLLFLDYPARTLTVAGGTPSWDAANHRLTLSNVTFTEASPGFVCEDGDADGAFCDIVPGPSVATTGDVVITYTDSTLTAYNGVAHTYQLANGTGAGCIGQGGPDWCANGVLTFSGTIPSAASASQVLATTYNELYEATPSLGEIDGNYTGSAGVDTAISSGATLNIDSEGVVTGAELTGCTYAGTVVPHGTGGNVYDVTLNFTAGGTCTYAGAFTGAATYDATAGTLTVTAVIDNDDRDKGFLFTGSVAQ